MQFIEPNVELWEQGTDMDAIWNHIAKCVRVCYQSTPKNDNETEEAFVKRVLFRDDEHWNSVKNHLAMLEHGTIYLHVVQDFNDEHEVCNFYRHNKYSKVISKPINDITHHFITTNLRVIIENYREHDLQYLCEPSWHERRYTFCFTTNIGVSREFNRHRVNSIAEESTRYCNYNKRNSGQLNIGFPAWLLNESDMTFIERHQYDPISEWAEDILNFDDDRVLKEWSDTEVYLCAISFAQWAYNMLIKKGWLPQQAREVLPLATKTQLVHTAFESDWRHFIALRSEGVSGKPHPNAKLLGDQVAEILTKITANN